MRRHLTDASIRRTGMSVLTPLVRGIKSAILLECVSFCSGHQKSEKWGVTSMQYNGLSGAPFPFNSQIPLLKTFLKNCFIYFFMTVCA